jgi:hypothetical protein
MSELSPAALPSDPSDRQIYKRASALAYICSLFVHSWDESGRFWETNRKSLVIQFVFLALGAHVWALVRGWDYALNEVLLGTAITVGTPLSAAALLYLWGVIKAPYKLHLHALIRLAEAEAALESATSERVFRQSTAAAYLPRPKVHVQFEWSGSHLNGCYEPLTLKNDSDVAAQRIQVENIKSPSGEVARFPLIPYLDAHAERQIWPEIEGADTRSGHPDFAKFMWHAMVGEGLNLIKGDNRPKGNLFQAGTALPFDITYRDFEGHDWRTSSHVKIGGEWGAGRIAVETLGFG